MRQVVKNFRVTDVSRLIERVQQVGQRLILAQPKEMVVGNIVRRVLGVIREEAEEDREGGTSGYSDADSESRPQTPRENDIRHQQRPALPSSISTFSPLRHGGLETQESFTQSSAHYDDHFQGSNNDTGSTRPPLLTATSMFSLLSHPVSTSASPNATPGSQSPKTHSSLTTHALAALNAPRDLRAEVVEGIDEIVDELSQVEDQIAGYALEHIHSNEIILTHSPSVTVHKFLLKAAAKRKFTVILIEAFPNDHEATHAMITGSKLAEDEDDLRSEPFRKSLTAAGITVVLVPDSAVFAIMSRVNKVILGTQVVLANGGLVAAVGAKTIAKAANMHRTPVIVLSGIYKLSPVYPFDFNGLIEHGDASKIIGYENGELVDKVEVDNPLSDYVPAELIDLYITNMLV